MFDQLIRGLDRPSARSVLDSVSQFETSVPIDGLVDELAREPQANPRRHASHKSATHRKTGRQPGPSGRRGRR